MEDCQHFLVNHAIMITDVGPLDVCSREEVKDLIHFHFSIRKHEFMVYGSNPEPFTIVFQDSHDRDVIFVAGRVVDGPIELGFHEWDLDRSAVREIIPYYVKFCLEGIPLCHHAWCKEIAAKIVCDEASIKHVEEVTLNKADLRTFDCWVLCKDPSRIPQMVYLSLGKSEPGLGGVALVQSF
jgi:hypothetical protein